MNYYLLILLAILQIADTAITIYALRTGLATERNPFLRKLVEAIGRDRAMVGWRIIAIALLIYYRDSAERWEILALCALYTATLVNNLLVIRKMKKKA